MHYDLGVSEAASWLVLLGPQEGQDPFSRWIDMMDRVADGDIYGGSGPMYQSADVPGRNPKTASVHPSISGSPAVF